MEFVVVLYMLRVLSAKDDDSIAEELESNLIVGVAAVLRWNETRGRKEEMMQWTGKEVI